MAKFTHGAAQYKRSKRICSIVIDGERCAKSVVAWDMCDNHYRQQRAGKPFRWPRKQRYSNATLARDADGNKECVYCMRWLPTGSFHTGNATADKLQIFCIDCGVKMSASRHEADPSLRRRAHLMYRYGITLEQYDSMWEAQGKACAICRTTTAKVKGWHVDHDHSCHPTGGGCVKCVRGILCHHCNTALGHLKDDPALFRSAIAYLEGARREDTGLGPGDDSNQVVHVELVA